MPQWLRRLTRKNSFVYILYNIPRLLKGYYPIFLDYPFEPQPRYGYGKPPHPELYALLANERERFRGALCSFLKWTAPLQKIPLREGAATEPCWMNDWLGGLDTTALYGFVAQRNPKLYIEIGSGYSTKVVRRAIRDNGLQTRVVSIDPQPRAEIDQICDEVVRRPLEEADLSMFADLQAGDVLFMDGSHRCFMNSDVTVFFLEILPRLAPGVLVHIHDIDLPWDYMPERAHWYYSEQYLLAVSLLAGHRGWEVRLANAFVSREPDLMAELEALWAELPGVARAGGSFWVETK